MERIEASGLVKQFGSTHALRGIDLAVGPGELVALVGPNGAGKSTLLRILATTVLADAGRAEVAGHNVATDPAAVRGSIGLMLGDERSWYWRLSGRHNLEFFGMLHGLSRRQARVRTDELLERFGLGAAADRRFAGYSSGMRARLSLARALIAEPPVLLLDEPSQSLDPVAAASFRETLTGLARERGVGGLFVTHDLHEAAATATRVTALVDGRVAFTQPGGGAAAELERALVEAVGP